MYEGQQANLAAGRIYGADVSTQAETAAPSAFALAHQHLSNEVQMLHKALRELEGRLRPVLQPQPEGTEKDGPRPISATISQQVGEQAALIAAATQRVGRMIERLEI